VYVAACLGAVACSTASTVAREDAAEFMGHCVEPFCAERLVPPAESLPDWMKRPPCDAEMDEVEIQGRCWQATSREVPCGRLYRYERKCYRPIDGGKDKP
jgi:hypothetical protein